MNNCKLQIFINQVKRAQQTEAREHHTNQIKLKARRQAKELQGELAIDMKILEALLTETENEKEEAVKRKVGRLRMWTMYGLAERCSYLQMSNLNMKISSL